MKRAELWEDDDGTFFIKLILEVERCGDLEFRSSYPDKMTRSEAEARFLRLCDNYDFARVPIPSKKMGKDH